MRQCAGVRASRVFIFVLVAGFLPGCGVSDLSFREDTRVEITAPKDRAEVRLPLTVTWTVHDFDVTGKTAGGGKDAGYFGVFVDRAPQPPGQTLEWLVRDDKLCRPEEGCPDAAYLAERNIHSTTETEFTIDRLPDFTQRELREFHEIIIVLLDTAGRRIGESAFAVEFQVLREER